MAPASCPSCDCQPRSDRHDRAPARQPSHGRTCRGARRSAHERYGHQHAKRDEFHRSPKHLEGDRVLPLASPPPSWGRGHFSIPVASSQPTGLWGEMMNRWLPEPAAETAP